VAGDEAVEIVPAAHVFAGGRESGALAIDFEQAVVVEYEVVGVDAVVLLLQWAAGELYVSVFEFLQELSRRLAGGGDSETGGTIQRRRCCCAFEKVPSG
jgi:hypothetical protein